MQNMALPTNTCRACGEPVHPQRWALNIHLCMDCGETQARNTLKMKASMCQPINKSAPTYISDLMMLKQLNPKRVGS